MLKLKQLVLAVSAVVLSQSPALAATSGATITADLPSGCLFAAPNFTFPVGTIDFGVLALQGYVDSTFSIQAGCSAGVTGALTTNATSIAIDADFVARVRRSGECGEPFFTGYDITGDGTMETIPVCVRIEKANSGDSILQFGARALTVNDPTLFQLAVK